MKTIFAALIALTVASPAVADVIIWWGPGHRPIQQNYYHPQRRPPVIIRPRVVIITPQPYVFVPPPIYVVPTPQYQLTPIMGDTKLAAQTVALALTVNIPAYHYDWVNQSTGEFGSVVLYGSTDSNSCRPFLQTVHQNGQPEINETFTACHVGGSGNTWMINNQNVVSSEDVAELNNDCWVRYASISGSNKFVESTAISCFQDNTWTVQQ